MKRTAKNHLCTKKLYFLKRYFLKKHWKTKRFVIGPLMVIFLFSLFVGCAQESVDAWEKYYLRGVEYLEQGDYEKAIDALSAAIEIDPERSEAQKKLEEALAAQKSMPDSESFLPEKEDKPESAAPEPSPTEAAKETSQPDTSSGRMPETTAAPTPDNTASFGDPSIVVTDALHYQREAIPVYEDAGQDLGDQVLIIPRISLDAEGAQALNDKIYTRYADVYEKLLNYSEENVLYNIRYSFRVHEGAIGILMEEEYGWQYSDRSVSYVLFYYDMDEDRELTFAEYLDKFGFEEEQLASQLACLDAKDGSKIKDFLGDSPKLDGCTIDRNGTTAVFSHIYREISDSYDGIQCWLTGPIV